MKLGTVSAATVIAVATIGVLSPSAEATEPGRHCWAGVDKPNVLHCFDSFAAVVSDLSASRISLPLGATTLTGAQRDAIAVGPLAIYVIGQVWADDNYTDDSLTYTASGDCDNNSDVDWQVASMSAEWNDRVTSAKSYGKCETKLFENPSFGGATLGYFVNTPNVGGAMNDRTSSIRWR